MNLLITFLIAISLSMDAFSLALSIGVASFPIKKCFLLSFTVGVFHFFMPLLGSIMGANFIEKLRINPEFLTGIIFLYIAIQMFKEYKNSKDIEFNMNIIGTLIFAFGVSLDSFGVGFTYDMSVNQMIITSLIFSIFSFFFTFLGLLIGKFINKIMGSIAILVGASIMTILSIINFVNFCYFN